MTRAKQFSFFFRGRLKIAEPAYQIPVLASPNFLGLQKNLKIRQKLLQNGIRSSTHWLGLRETQEILSFEERFSELEKLVQDYQALVALLARYEEGYQLFFVQVIDELKTFVIQQCQELADAEKERLELEQSLKDDESLLTLLKQQKLQILRSTFLLHHASQLLVKKVETLKRSFKQLAQEVETPRKFIEKILARLNKYLRLSRLQKKINLIEENIKGLAELARNFEESINQDLGGVSKWLEQGIELDNELAINLEQIRLIIENIRHQDSRFLLEEDSETLSESLLNFLGQSHLKPERLGEVFERIRAENNLVLEPLDFLEDFFQETSALAAIDSIQNRVNTQLIKLSWALRCLVVSKQNDSDYRTIQDAINKAQPGMRILIRPGLYMESLVINKPLEILGDGEVQEIVIQSVDSDGLLMQTDYAVVKNLTWQGNLGQNSDKNFVVNIPQGRLVIEDCCLTASSLSCIVIHGSNANPIIRRCKISHGKENGILVHTNGQGVIEDCEIFANSLAGVAIKNEASPILRRCKISQGENCGVLVSTQGKGLIEHCQIFNHINAGVEIRKNGNPVIRHCQIYEEKTSGIFVHTNGQGIIRDCEIFGNGLQGIAIEEGGNPVIYQSRIYQGKESGISISRQGKGIVKDCEIFENAWAGVEIRDGGNPFLERCRIYQGKKHGILVSKNGNGIVKDCEIFAKDSCGVEIREGSNLSIRQCKIHQSGESGTFFPKNGKGTVKNCEIFEKACAAIKIGENSKPLIDQCRIDGG